MTLVRDVMRTGTICISRSASVSDAVSIMAAKKIGFLIVVESDKVKRLVGVVSDTDCVRKVLFEKKDPEKITVGEIMSRNVVKTSSETPLVEAVEVMCEHKLKRLPVSDKGMVKGVLSITDIVPLFIEYKKKILDFALNF